MTAALDVGIIGGGPAGSGMAAYLAQAGIRCAVFEKELFPRPHVGESLVPSSTRIFNEIGFTEQMERSGFPRKYGAAWTAAGGQKVYDHDWKGLAADSYADLCFAEREQEGVDRSYTWHVDRGRFDLMLLQHAASLGAEVYTGVTVQEVDVSDSRRPKIGVSVGGARVQVPVRVIIDASGRRTFLGSRLGLRVRDPVFDQYALHTWFEGLDREAVAGDSGRSDFIFVHFLPLNDSWIWQIPITDTITSVGVVTQKKNFAKSRADRQQFFWDCLETRPDLAERLRGTDQLRSLKEEGDYSYAMQEICGDSFVLIGDAARFVDPIFSTGVSIALNSARFAARDVIDAIQNGKDTRKSAFDTYEQTLRRGTKNWYDFIAVYYRLNILFTAFVNDPRYRIDVLKLLQGDVYDVDEPPILRKMKEIIRTVESNPRHIWHESLGTLTSETLRTAL
jgi:1H-pyrrole-2-carbonyl-[peptidyl-carrier protein] chlorinase